MTQWYSIPPELRQQGMEQQLGWGAIHKIIPVNSKYVLLLGDGLTISSNVDDGKGKPQVGCPNKSGTLSQDGTLLALSGLERGSDKCYLWALPGFRFLRTLSAGSLASHYGQGIAFSPDGQLLASIDRFDISLWNTITYQVVKRFCWSTKFKYCVIFSPNRRVIAYAEEGDDKGTTVRLWNVDSDQEEEVLRLDERGVISELVFSPDGQILAWGDGKGVNLWRLSNNRQLQHLGGQSGAVKNIAFSPDGCLIASTAKNDSIVRLWEVQTGQELRKLEGHESEVAALAFMPDGRLVSVGDDNILHVWSQLGDKHVVSRYVLPSNGHAGTVWSLAFSPDDRYLASGGADHTVRLWSLYSGQEVKCLEKCASDVASVAFSPDGKMLAVGEDGVIWLMDVASGREIRCLEGHTGFVFALAFHFSGSFLLSIGNDKIIRLWDVARGEELKSFKLSASTAVFGPEGPILAAGPDKDKTHLWKVAVDSPLQSLFGPSRQTFRGHKGEVRQVVLSPSGHLLACVEFDGTIRLQDSISGRELKTLTGLEIGIFHVWNVRRIAFSPDNRSFVLAGYNLDKEIHIWDVSSGREIGVFSFSKPSSLALSSDGRYLAAGNDEGLIRVWTIRERKQS